MVEVGAEQAKSSTLGERLGEGIQVQANALGDIAIPDGPFKALTKLSTSVAETDSQLRRIQGATKASAEAVQKARDEAFSVAQAGDIRVDPKAVMAGFEEIASLTGDLDLSTKSLRTLGVVMQATGASGQDAGRMIGTLLSGMKLDNAEDAIRILDQLNGLATTGHTDLKSMSAEFNTLARTFSQFGLQGKVAADTIATLQTALVNANHSPAQSTAAINGLLGDLQSKEKVKKLNDSGVSTLESDGKTQRNPLDVVKDLITKTNNDPQKIKDILGEQGAKVASSLGKYYDTDKKAFNLPTLADGSGLAADAALNAGGVQGALTALNAAKQNFLDRALNRPIQWAAEQFNSLSPETQQTLVDIAGTGVLAAGGYKLATSTIGTGKKALDFLQGKKSPAAEKGSGGPISPLPLPVTVVNWPAGFGVGGTGRNGGNGLIGMPDVPGGKPPPLVDVNGQPLRPTPPLSRTERLMGRAGRATRGGLNALADGYRFLTETNAGQAVVGAGLVTGSVMWARSHSASEAPSDEIPSSVSLSEQSTPSPDSEGNGSRSSLAEGFTAVTDAASTMVSVVGLGELAAGAVAGASSLLGGASSSLANFGGLASKLLGRVATPLAAVATAADVATHVADGDTKGAAIAAGEGLGGMGGAWAGAAVGAAAGSVVPVVGTAIGGLIGAIGGGLLGSELGSSLAEYMHGAAQSLLGSDGQPQRSESLLKLEVTAADGTTVRVRDIQSTGDTQTEISTGLAMSIP